MITAENITNEQIRELRHLCGIDGTGEQMIVRLCGTALGDYDAAFPFTAEQRAESVDRARTRCAEILNARAVSKHWPDCAMNHGGSTCDMGPECGTDDAASKAGAK